MTDPRYTKFSFNLTCHIASSTSLLPPFDTRAFLEVYERMYELFLSTRFLELTKFPKLGIVFAMVEDTDDIDEIRYTTSKTKLLVVRKFHCKIMQPQLEKDYKAFMTKHLTSVLIQVCKKYKLNSEALVNLQPAPESHLREVTIVKKDEVRLHVKLALGGFGDRDDAEAINAIVGEIDERLRTENIGYVDATDVGTGFRTVYCCGNDAQLIYKSISPLLLGCDDKHNDERNYERRATK